MIIYRHRTSSLHRTCVMNAIIVTIIFFNLGSADRRYRGPLLTIMTDSRASVAALRLAAPVYMLEHFLNFPCGCRPPVCEARGERPASTVNERSNELVNEYSC